MRTAWPKYGVLSAGKMRVDHVRISVEGKIFRDAYFQHINSEYLEM